jgi:hypothetical protein
MDRDSVEKMLNHARDTESHIWETLPKPVWYMEKYNCFPRRLTLMEAYNRAIDNTHTYTTSKIETQTINQDIKFPDLPVPETEKIITLTSETKD